MEQSSSQWHILPRELDRTGHRGKSTKLRPSGQTLPGAVRPRPFQGSRAQHSQGQQGARPMLTTPVSTRAKFGRAKTKAPIAKVKHGQRKQGMAKVILNKSQCFQHQHTCQGLQGQNLQGQNQAKDIKPKARAKVKANIVRSNSARSRPAGSTPTRLRPGQI